MTTAHRQVVFHPLDPEEPERAVAAEDIGLVVLDAHRCSISVPALRLLVESDAAVLVTDERHLPAGLLLPLQGHTLATARLRAQVAAGRPRCKQAWRQIVAAKIRAQAALCVSAPDAAERLHGLARSVRSGDAGNSEGVAAAVYWPAVTGDPTFRRRPREDGDVRNVFLDYGYGILRATCARAIVKAGLHPALGVHHRSRDNPFCLADDLMEPLRPLVDRVALGLHASGVRELSRDARTTLLGVLHRTVWSGGGRGPLDVALERYAASFALYLVGEAEAIDIPVAP